MGNVDPAVPPPGSCAPVTARGCGPTQRETRRGRWCRCHVGEVSGRVGLTLTPTTLTLTRYHLRSVSASTNMRCSVSGDGCSPTAASTFCSLRGGGVGMELAAARSGCRGRDACGRAATGAGAQGLWAARPPASSSRSLWPGTANALNRSTIAGISLSTKAFGINRPSRASGPPPLEQRRTRAARRGKSRAAAAERRPNDIGPIGVPENRERNHANRARVPERNSHAHGGHTINFNGLVTKLPSRRDLVDGERRARTDTTLHTVDGSGTQTLLFQTCRLAALSASTARTRGSTASWSTTRTLTACSRRSAGASPATSSRSNPNPTPYPNSRPSPSPSPFSS